ncbi:MAG: NAD(P)/FAD-dependent oxidoreductase [Polyangia bacterium]
METDVDVVVIGGGLAGSMAATMLSRRGLRVTVLESRPVGKEQKAVVGEALTEGTSVFLRHELGLTEWLSKNTFRKFGFDFLTLPREGELPQTAAGCHELLLSLKPFEEMPGAFPHLIPTYHVERTAMNAHLAELARQAGARYLSGASVESVEIGDGSHSVRYAQDGASHVLRCRWVLDASGRRNLLGRQLGITHPVKELDTASVWNRFSNVNADEDFWRTFGGVDRRRQTIHFTGPGFWIWWIHQKNDMTSVGVSFDNKQHQPNVKTDDHGFWEMLKKHPPAYNALKGARALEPFQYYAHLPYRSQHWVSKKGYSLIGDAAWFVDALYSIGIETACRQLVAVVPLIVDACRGPGACAATIDKLNMEFELTQTSVVKLNKFKYEHAWARPHVMMQTALYELGEIAELYHMQAKSRWTPAVLSKHYRLQWSTPQRLHDLEQFMSTALEKDGDRDLGNKPLLKKALLPGKTIYAVTWPLWKLPHARPYFFKLTRTWGYMERYAQRMRLWPDGLKWMASGVPFSSLLGRFAPGDAQATAEATHRKVS